MARRSFYILSGTEKVHNRMQRNGLNKTKQNKKGKQKRKKKEIWRENS